MSDGTQTSLNRLRCQVCRRTFSRSEHLRRHELTHSNRRQFNCDQCGKEFLRKDALDRHRITHEITGPNLLEKGGRACLSCASAKVRCSGELPACSRCRTRAMLPCQYPLTAVSGAGFSTSHSVDRFDESAVPLTIASNSHAHATNLSPESQLNFVDQSVDTGDQILHTADFSDRFQEWNVQSTINWLSNEDFTYLNGFNMNDFENNSFLPMGNSSTVADQQTVEFRQQLDVLNEGVRPASVQDHNENAVRHNMTVTTVSSATPRSNASSMQDNHIEGEFYVDGQPARLPRVKRRRIHTSTPVTTRSDGYGIPLELDGLNSTHGTYNGQFQILDDAYENMQRAFEYINSLSGSSSCPVDSESNLGNAGSFFSETFTREFTSKGVFERLIESYVDSFHLLMPILHIESFRALDWQLVLPMASIGARFIDGEEAATLADSLDEFTRRLLSLADGKGSLLPQSDVTNAQLQLLYLITATYSKVSTPKNGRTLLTQTLMEFCIRKWTYNEMSNQELGLDEQWKHWRLGEMRRRTGYAIWLLDFMLAVHFQQRPCLNLGNAEPELPCCERVWQANSAQTWHDTITKVPQPSSMSDILRQLYIEKSLPEGLGEFSRILIIYGLFRHMSETESYLTDPLHRWTPSAERQSASEALSESNLWMPSLPIFAKWRNSTCDCLDVLHWSANATIGLASGMEHPTVMHLHFARVVLLTPYQKIVTFARYLARNGNTHLDAEILQDMTIIRRWAVQDQYKARLAMIHAGVLFWHVRKYSSNAFYEPASVALATLALWAFCTFSRPGILDPRPNESVQAEQNADNSDPEEGFCDIILLDRPTDDELVQQFVREGNKMRANMNGVGDLYADGAARKVLVAGRKLLRTIVTWRSHETWITLIDQLITISKN